MTLLDARERSERGRTVQAEVIGHAAPAPATLYEESWRDFVYAEVWSRPALDSRARYLIAITGAALNGTNPAVLDGYVGGALKSGELTLAELREAALHFTVYAGWSRGGDLDAAVSRAAQALGLPPAETPPIQSTPWDPQERIAKGGREFENVMTFSGVPAASPLLEAIPNFVFAEMWSRPGLDQRSRRWISLVCACESSAEVPIKTHLHAAMASGNCSPEELQEFVLQYAIHAGWPKASLVQGAVFEMAQKVAQGLPWQA